MDWIVNPEIWIALVTLTALEIVLGIDNIIFISILVGKLPQAQQRRARRLGLGLAMVIAHRLLLFSLAWIVGLTAPLFTVLGQAISRPRPDPAPRRPVPALQGDARDPRAARGRGRSRPSTPAQAASFGAVIVQIMLLDIVFSLDSVITAVGMVDELAVMIAAVVIAVGDDAVRGRPIGDFVDRHPTIKMLALAFLLMIGMALMAEGFDQHIPKGYIYFAMAFSVFVEMLNLPPGASSNRPSRSTCAQATSGKTSRPMDWIKRCCQPRSEEGELLREDVDGLADDERDLLPAARGRVAGRAGGHGLAGGELKPDRSVVAVVGDVKHGGQRRVQGRWRTQRNLLGPHHHPGQAGGGIRRDRQTTKRAVGQTVVNPGR